MNIPLLVANWLCIQCTAHVLVVYILAISEWQTVEYICTFTYVQTHVCSVNVLAANFYVLHKVLSKECLC